MSSRPVALVDGGLRPAVIIQATEAARRWGVSENLTASQGMARCADLVIRNRCPAGELSATDVLLQTAGAFSPNIEATAPGVCTIDLRGLRFEGEPALRQWASRILSALAQCKLDAQIGFAPAPGLALIAAQAAAPVLVVGEPREFISKLPVKALHPPPETASILELWGIQTIGAFLDLGRDKVAERLGPEAAALFDGIGLVRPLNIVLPPETYVERMEFQFEIETTEPLLFVLRRFLEQLAGRLELVHRVVAALDLRLHLSSGAVHARTFKVPSPTNNLRVLFRMLQTHLETLRTDAPIVSLELHAQPGASDRHQFGLFETTLRDPNQFAETLARLVALCGSENVGSPRLQATHRPDSFRMAVPDFSRDAASTCPRREIKTVGLRTPGLQLRRFRPALPAIMEFREQRPALVRCRAFHGAINSSDGPFLASGDWWDERGWAQEQWDIQMTDGRLCRITRRADGCFVEGVYD